MVHRRVTIITIITIVIYGGLGQQTINIGVS